MTERARRHDSWMGRHAAWMFAPVSLVLSCGACGPTCDDVGNAALEVIVSGELASGCEVTVVAYDGDDSFDLSPEEDDRECRFFLWENRPGTYTIEVDHAGQTTRAAPVTVNNDGCSVRQKSVTVSL